MNRDEEFCAPAAELPDSGLSMDPLDEIGGDLRRLMKTVGLLQHELLTVKDKAESEMRKLMLELIAVSDSFSNVFKNIEPKLGSADPQTKIWVGNFRTVYKLILRSIAAWGVVPVEAVIGEKVNPYWHSVFEVEECPGREDETILEEIKKGYMWNGKLLRAAEVKAVKNS